MNLIRPLLVAVAALIAFAYSGNAQTVGFTADINGPFGGAGNNGGLNIGHTFSVGGNGIQVYELGVYDFGGNGLNSSHVVTLFSDSGSIHTPVTGGSVTV